MNVLENQSPRQVRVTERESFGQPSFLKKFNETPHFKWFCFARFTGVGTTLARLDDFLSPAAPSTFTKSACYFEPKSGTPSIAISHPKTAYETVQHIVTFDEWRPRPAARQEVIVPSPFQTSMDGILYDTKKCFGRALFSTEWETIFRKSRERGRLQTHDETRTSKLNPW
mmetsp:Transcript_19141/g.27755  ORF Transcript_19141/g.27755 Transcript_19141/m.27755 type:complete len:170 (-) Transcript_19141:833-1342(-)